MRWNTLANILAKLSIPFSMVGQLTLAPSRRRARTGQGLKAYFDALELRQMFSGDPPAIAPFARTIDVNQPYTFVVTDFSNVFFDNESDPMDSVQITQLPTRGTLNLTVGSVTDPVTAGQVIPAADIGGLVYQPDNGSTGDDFFLWLASDGTNFAQTFATVTMTVEKPLISGFSKTFFVNETFAFTAADFTSNYTHSHSLSTITIMSLPAHGQLRLAGNSVVATQVIAVSSLDVLTFVPVANFVGGDSFTWRASDGTVSSDTATVQLTSIVDLTDASRSAFVNHTIVFDPTDITGHYTGPGSADTVTILTLPTNGTLSFTDNTTTSAVTAGQQIAVSELANLVFTPSTNFVGTRTFTWQAASGTLSTNIVTVSMTLTANFTAAAKSTFVNTPVNFAPTDVTDNYTGSAPVSVTILTLPAHGKLTLTLNATTANVAANAIIAIADVAGLTYTPTTSYTGIDTFNWSVSDGSFQSNPAAVNLTVASPFTPFAKSMDKGTFVNFTQSDFTDATELSVSHVQILRLPSNGTLSLTIGASTTNVTRNQVIELVNLSGLKYTPKSSFTGTDSILWTSSGDGTSFVTPGSTITLTVKALDVADFSKAVGQNTPFTFTAADFANNFTGGNALQTVRITALPTNGKLQITSGTNSATDVIVNQTLSTADLATLTYTTTSTTFMGSDTFSWTGADGGAYASPVAKVNLTISALKVTGSGVTILDNDTTPSQSDFTDFAGTAAASGPSLTRTYIITNITNHTINLTGSGSLVQLADIGTTSGFTITTQPTDSILAPNATTSFTITFLPPAAGVLENTVRIPTDTAGSDSLFNFDIQGTGLSSVNVPTTSTVSGLQMATTVQGKGTGAFNGAILHMTYTGRLLNGNVFDSSAAHGNIPLAFRLDNSPTQSFINGNSTNDFVNFPVIRGWEDGIQGMKVGEHRTLIIPSEFGYGASGSGATIPPNATLIFDIVLNAIDGSPSLGVTFSSTQSAILPGDTTPSVSDGTDFGTVPTSANSVVHTFAGTNNSPASSTGAPLGIIHQTGFSITGANPKDFTFAGFMLGNFQIVFKPTAPGVRNATINFFTDDPLNKKFSFAVRGNSAPFVDLSVLSVGTSTFPIATVGGFTTTIPVVINNHGNTAVPSSSPTTDVRISIQNTADTTSAPIVVSDADFSVNVSGMGPGAKTINVPITIPGSLTLSTYSFIADINTTGAVAEAVAANSLTMTTNITGTLDSSTIPSLVVRMHEEPGSAVKGNVNVTVRNTGTLAFASNEKVNITIQAVNGTVSTLDIATGSSFSVAGLKSGATKTFTVPVDFTTGLTDGTYTLRAVLALTPTAFESNTADNTFSANASGQSLSIVSEAPNPDLTVEFGTSRFGVSGGNSYQTTLPVIVTNAGNVAVPTNGTENKTDIHVYLSDTNNTSNVFQVAEILNRNFAGLKATKSTTINIPINVNGTIPAGDYVYVVTVNDSGAITESDSTNNDATASMNISGTLISSTLPSSISHTAPATKGSVTIRLTNDGDLTMPSGFVVKVQIYLHNVNSNVDTLLNPGARTLSPDKWDKSGEFFDFNYSVKVPKELPAGNYILLAKLIPSPAFRESSIEDSNVTTNLFNNTIPITIT